MLENNDSTLILSEWIDDHAEMLSEWEAESRYNMDFVVEKRKLEKALKNVGEFLKENGIQEELREELKDTAIRENLLACLPKDKRGCSDFELNCYYDYVCKKDQSSKSEDNRLRYRDEERCKG